MKLVAGFSDWQIWIALPQQQTVAMKTKLF